VLSILDQERGNENHIFFHFLLLETMIIQLVWSLISYYKKKNRVKQAPLRPFCLQKRQSLSHFANQRFLRIGLIQLPYIFFFFFFFLRVNVWFITQNTSKQNPHPRRFTSNFFCCCHTRNFNKSVSLLFDLYVCWTTLIYNEFIKKDRFLII
jgi:hypothetical protein